MSVAATMSGTFATIFSFDASRKWIIRDGRMGISRGGSGAPIARGWKNSRGFRMEAKDILWDPDDQRVKGGTRTWP